MATSTGALQFHDLVKTYRRSGSGSQGFNAVDGINVTINPGEFVCVIGASGCGKSTFLHIAAGLEEPTAGEMTLDGTPINGPSIERGLVFQKDSVFPWMRVIDNVAYALKVKGISKTQRHARAKELLADVGLPHVAHSWPKELSGGMRKRVAIAATLANRPDVLLMDEPFGALDYVTRLQLQQVVLKLWEEHGMTIIFVTHDVDEALTLADRLIVMNSGRVSDDHIIDIPRPRTVADFAAPEVVSLKSKLLSQLGLESAS